MNFSTVGLANGGVVSDCVTSSGAVETSGCTSSYTGINNPSTNANPAGGLNSYATNEGTPGGSDGTDMGSVSGGDATEMRWVGSAGSIITNPNGTYGLFLSGAWAEDGDSDAFNQIFYSESSNGEIWSTPTPVISTDYSFSASYNQDNNVPNPGGGNYGSQGLGISAYYEGRAYGPSVVQNPNGTLTMVFAGYRFPKSIPSTAGVPVGTGTPQWTPGSNDLTMYRNILTTTLTESTTPTVATTTTLSTPPTSPAVVGQVETVGATVAPQAPGTGTATGTVTFEGTGGTTLCTGTLNEQTPDTATCTYSYSGPTDDSVTANYVGDTNYASGASSPSAVTVDQDVTTTSTPVATDTGTGDPANPAAVGEPLTLSSTVQVSEPGAGTPTGTVIFADSGGTLCSATLDQANPDVASCTYTYTAPNAGDNITASYGGDTNDAVSTSAALDEVVDQDVTTTSTPVATDTGTGDPANPAAVGEPLTLSSTVQVSAPGAGTPTGTVIFADSGGTLCSATLDQANPDVASCTYTYTAPNAGDNITASYGGDTNDAVSTSAGLNEVIEQGATTTTLSSSANPSLTGQSVTFTAEVRAVAPAGGTPGGTVTFAFNNGQTPVCVNTGDTVMLSNGDATCTVDGLVPGQSPENVHASYSGSNDFSSSAAQPISEVINKDPVAIAVSASADPVTIDQRVTFTATISAASPGVGTPTGIPTWTIRGLGGSVTCKKTSTSVSGTTLQATCKVGSDTFMERGPYSVTVAYPGDQSFGAASTTATEQVTAARSTVTLTVHAPTSSGGEGTITARVTGSPSSLGTPTGMVTFTIGSVQGQAVACSSGTNTMSLSGGSAVCTVQRAFVHSGSPYSAEASYSGDSVFAPSASSLSEITVP